MTDGENVRVLLSEDVSPQDIAVLLLIKIMAMLKSSNSRHALTVPLIQLIQREPFYDEKGSIVVIPTALDLCNKVYQDTKKYSLEADEGVLNSSSEELRLVLLQALWNIESVKSLSVSTGDLTRLISDSKVLTYKKNGDEMRVSPRSAIGNYIRKMTTSLHLLNFDETFLLFEAFMAYREPTRKLINALGGITEQNRTETHKISKAKSPKQDEELFSRLKQRLDDLHDDISIILNKESPNRVKVLPISKYSLLKLLKKQQSILETYGLATPKELNDIMKLMTSSLSNVYTVQNGVLASLASYFYIKYLECLNALDYQGSLQALHQYFDYMVSNNSKFYYHYALISRASLHQHFGEDEKAFDSIEEAISVARENRDNNTLTFILSWLYNLMRNKPQLWKIQNFYHSNNELHLLDFLVKKSKTVSLLLYSLSYHFEALHIMDNGGSMNKYLESLHRATYVSIHDSCQTFIKSMEMSATIWSRIGIFTISELYTDLALEYAKSTGNKVDEISIGARMAHLNFIKSNADEAYNVLDSQKAMIDKDFSLYKTLNIRSLMLLTKISINKCRKKYASKVMEVLNNEDIQEIDLKAELVYLAAEVQSTLGNKGAAMKLINQFLITVEDDALQVNSNIHTLMRLKLLICRIYNDSGVHTRAMSLLIQQLQQAKKVGFISIVVEGLILLGSVLNNMGSYIDAYDLLMPKMVTIGSVNNRELIAGAYYELAVSTLKIYQSQDLMDKIQIPKAEVFNNFLNYLNNSINGFKEASNISSMDKCFRLELEMAELHRSTDLLEHSKASLEKLNKRLVLETQFGYSS